jgi:hypothetical protein
VKLGRRFKPLLLWTSGALYATGLAAWLLVSRFQVDRGYGPEPRPARLWALHAHSVTGLLFLGLFGYLWRVHLEPGIGRPRRRPSGLLLAGALALLFLTVPLLFYAAGAAARAWTVRLHEWLGALLPLPFLLHRRGPRRRSGSSRA